MVLPKALKVAAAGALALAVFATGVVVGRATGDGTSTEARACRVFDLASSRLEAAAVSPTRRGYFDAALVESWREQTARIDSVVSTGELDEPVFSALRDVGNAYAATAATTADYVNADSWNSGRIRNVLAENAEAEFEAAKACDEVAS